MAGLRRWWQGVRADWKRFDEEYQITYDLVTLLAGMGCLLAWALLLSLYQ